MRRLKIILSIIVVVGIVLAIVFVSQVRNLRQQLRSSVRIIPTETKSREEPMQTGIEDSALASPPELLVKFRAGVSDQQITEITNRFNDRVQDEIEAVPGLVVIDDPDEAKPAESVASYQSLPEVEYAEPNYEITLDQSPTLGKLKGAQEPEVKHQWWQDEIGVTEAWNKTRGSEQIVIAILDTGIEYTHDDLKNNIWTRPATLAPYQDRDLGTIDDVHGYNAVKNDGEPIDDNGHGTSCAGIVGAECGNNIGICGVSPKTRIMALKFINAGGFGSVADAVEAINYAVNRKQAGVDLRIINVSWGLREASRALEDAIRKMQDSGILVVAASEPAVSYPTGYRLENILSVASLDRNAALVSSGDDVDVAAPGVNILTTMLGNDFSELEGTPMAAPVVSGVAALALAAHPEFSLVQLRSLLLESVDKRPALWGKVVTEGCINAARAVR